MTADDLSTPLGRGDAKRRRFTLPMAVPRAIAGVLGLCLGVFVLWAVLVDDPFGGEPAAVVAVNPRAPEQAAKPSEPILPAMQPKLGPPIKPAASETPEKNAPPGAKTVTIIDGVSGQRQEVVVADGTPAAGAIADPRLVEPSPHGAIPKIGADGARAADVYASPALSAAAKTEGPRVAIVVGGLGIGASGTSEALAELPAQVTLGFTPYGNDLERVVARARGEGREVLLQVPMEPFDYPDNDPGPQTLLTTQSPEQNVDRLHWSMSRFQGYVGIANYMGARFTASEQAVAPVMRDAARRGLIYFDDGTSSRSLTSQIAGSNNVAFAKATLVLDAVPTPLEIDKALSRLEAMARERGIAVGVATALPASIDRIARWARNAETRGIVLVPISAVASKPKSS